MDCGNVNPTQHLPWWLKVTMKITQSVWLSPGFELWYLRIRVQCDEFRSALCSVHSETLSQIALHSRWESCNRSLHLQPLQRCYCKNSERPTTACVIRRCYSITYTQSLNEINGLIAVGRVGNLLCGRPQMNTWSTNDKWKVRAHRTYFLALNTQCPNLREIYFYKQCISDDW